MKYTDQSNFDVVIMGAGFAGICQARHLLLNIPGIRIALIDPRPEDRQDRDMKVGESMVEIGALFVCKELGLQDYLIENHAPKYGLSFHWPKSPNKSTSLEDYFHVWANRQTHITSFHINRAVFERDVLKMVKQMGAVHYQGAVTDVDLTPGDGAKTVYVNTEQACLRLQTDHVIDAAGRNFIIGRKTDNLLRGPEHLYGVNNGASWMRVRNVDRKIFHDGYAPEGVSVVSRYYATNHWFGQGHWIWMIPTTTDTMELSVGLVHHHKVISSDQVSTSEKFLKFLEANHNLLYRIVTSGEQVDFVHWPQIAHRSKKMFSEDNWYVLGDAAYVLDGFYSYGTTTIALAAESITEIIRAKRAGEADVEEKRCIYNDFNLAYARGVNLLIREHDKQLGNASIMSWRVYFEFMWWFSVHIPMYIGKWHLNKMYARKFTKIISGNIDRFFPDLYAQFNQLVESEANIGIMDCYRADQLLGDYTPLKFHDDFLINTKLEPLRCNVFAGMKKGYLYIALWYLKFQWKAFKGIGLLKPRRIGFLFRLLGLSLSSAIAERVYKHKMRGVPSNSIVAKMREEFNRNYRYSNELPPW